MFSTYEFSGDFLEFFNFKSVEETERKGAFRKLFWITVRHISWLLIPRLLQ